MITIRIATNNPRKDLQEKLLVWMKDHKFIYNEITHEWSTFMDIQFIQWNPMFHIARKFDAEVTINFNRAPKINSLRQG
jgi:hypothetical protein